LNPKSALRNQILTHGILLAVDVKKVVVKRSTVSAFKWEYCVIQIDVNVVIAKIQKMKFKEEWRAKMMPL
jgi:hypothetical protein